VDSYWEFGTDTAEPHPPPYYPGKTAPEWHRRGYPLPSGMSFHGALAAGAMHNREFVLG
jgi:hypothetical protein